MKMKMVCLVNTNISLDVPVFTSELKLLKGPIADQDMMDRAKERRKGRRRILEIIIQMSLKILKKRRKTILLGKLIHSLLQLLQRMITVT